MKTLNGIIKENLTLQEALKMLVDDFSNYSPSRKVARLDDETGHYCIWYVSEWRSEFHPDNPGYRYYDRYPVNDGKRYNDSQMTIYPEKYISGYYDEQEFIVYDDGKVYAPKTW